MVVESISRYKVKNPIPDALTFDPDAPDGGLSAFCYSEPVPCVLNFTYNGTAYDQCTSDGLNETDDNKKYEQFLFESRIRT